MNNKIEMKLLKVRNYIPNEGIPVGNNSESGYEICPEYVMGVLNLFEDAIYVDDEPYDSIIFNLNRFYIVKSIDFEEYHQ